MELLLFFVGFILLIKASDYFVDASVKLAKIFKMPEVIIGATIVSLGTTLPETLVSATGSFRDLDDMAYGNAIGSIICNTALIAAITMVFLPSKVDKESLKRPIKFFFFAYIVYCTIAICFRKFDRLAGVILFSIFIAFVISVVRSTGDNEKKLDSKAQEKVNDNIFKQVVIIIISAIVIALGANMLVTNGTKIAIMLGVPESVVALTMVALGTSLPELMTAITAIRKKHGELSIGNIIGANFLNLVTVTGIAAMIGTVDISDEKTFRGFNASFIIDIPLVLIVMLILCVPPILKGRTYRWQGIILLIIYTIYVIFQFAY